MELVAIFLGSSLVLEIAKYFLYRRQNNATAEATVSKTILEWATKLQEEIAILRSKVDLLTKQHEDCRDQNSVLLAKLEKLEDLVRK